MNMSAISRNQNINKQNKSTESSSDSIKLTEIISDCLEPIFMYLSMADLYSVAVAHRNFSQTAALVLKQKYGSKKCMIDPSGVRIFDKHTLPPNYATEIESNQTYNQFTFLRLFGNSISRTRVKCDVSKIQHIENYIAEYCFETSVFIESFIFLPTDIPQTEVFMGKALAKQCFQIMGFRKLAIKHSGFIDRRFFVYLFEKRVLNLDKLSIRCKDGIFHDKIKKSEHFVFEDLKSFSLDSGTPYLFSRGPPPLLFNQLDSLELKGFCRLSMDWIKFIIQNKNLTQLKLYCTPLFCYHFAWPMPEVTNEQFLKIAKCMTNLKLLVIDANLIEIQYFLPEFLYEFKSLMELRLFWDYRLDEKIQVEKVLEEIAEEVDYEWDFYTRSRRAAFIRKQ